MSSKTPVQSCATCQMWNHNFRACTDRRQPESPRTSVPSWPRTTGGDTCVYWTKREYYRTSSRKRSSSRRDFSFRDLAPAIAGAIIAVILVLLF